MTSMTERTKTIEYALMVDFEDGNPSEIVPAKDAHHAEHMARTIYAGRPSWTVSREISLWRYGTTEHVVTGPVVEATR